MYMSYAYVLCLCNYVHVYVYVYVSVYIYVYVYVSLRMFLYVHVCLCLCLCMSCVNRRLPPICVSWWAVRVLVNDGQIAASALHSFYWVPAVLVTWAKGASLDRPLVAGELRCLRTWGYLLYTVACTPFAPPTPVRLSLSGAGGNLKTQSPAVHIIFNYRATHSPRGLLSSFSTTLTVYMHAVKATPMYSTEIHFMWRRQHSVSLRHDTNVK